MGPRGAQQVMKASVLERPLSVFSPAAWNSWRIPRVFSKYPCREPVRACVIPKSKYRYHTSQLSQNILLDGLRARENAQRAVSRITLVRSLLRVSAAGSAFSLLSDTQSSIQARVIFESCALSQQREVSPRSIYAVSCPLRTPASRQPVVKISHVRCEFH